MASAAADITLTFLLPSPYLLVYSIPLLVTAVIQTFAGAFLTLDRTCTFAPQAPVESGTKEIDGKPKFLSWWRLEGGVGGLASGWVFGADLATFLSLLIMNRTTSAPLSPAAFLAIHLPSSLLFTLLCGRFKLAALACTGLAGGVSLALICAILLHPTLLTRLIFVATLTPLSLLAALLPVPQTQRRALRATAAISGAFAVTLTLALLAHIPSWANAWQRLWLHQETGPAANAWGTGVEHGLSTAACVMLALGMVSDWVLRRTFGENPDQKWDAYLAQYAANLPNAGERAGTFQPVLSFWQRIFHPRPSTPILFPSDIDLKPTSKARSRLVSRRTFRAPTVGEDDSDAYYLPNMAASRKKRFEVKFQPLEGYSDSDSNSDTEGDREAKRESEPELRVADGAPHAYSPPQWKPWPRRDVRSGVSPGIVSSVADDGGGGGTGVAGDMDKEKEKEQTADVDGTNGGKRRGIAAAVTRKKSHRDEPGWRPGFLSRYANVEGSAPGVSTNASTTTGGASATTAKASDASDASFPPPPPSTSASSATVVSRGPHPSPSPSSHPPGAVPMTPSLIRAIDRIAVAQSEAYGYASTTPTPPGGSRSPSTPVAPRPSSEAPGSPSTPALTSPPTPPLFPPRADSAADKMRNFWERVQLKAGRR